MLGLLIVLFVALGLFGGVGYGYRERLGGYWGGGTSLLGLLVLIFILLSVLGAVHL